ncbi:unnamed protein product [Colias eurytheme]|nr:unnamed protein product [Colias eurytheme]
MISHVLIFIIHDVSIRTFYKTAWTKPLFDVTKPYTTTRSDSKYENTEKQYIEGTKTSENITEVTDQGLKDQLTKNQDGPINVLTTLMCCKCPPPPKCPVPKKKEECPPKTDPCAPKKDPCAPKKDPCAPKEDPCAPKKDPCAPKDDPCAPKKQDPCVPKKCEPRAKFIQIPFCFIRYFNGYLDTYFIPIENVS